ncbi:adenosylcobinamide-phosphate synthase CbiB [Melaminivora sp.]
MQNLFSLLSGPWPDLGLLGAALLLALVIDRLWGEPPARLHPVVWMGQALGLLGQRLAPRQERAADYRTFWLFAGVWCGLAAIVWIAAWLLQSAALRLPWWAAALLLGLLLKPLLAWRMLRAEVLAVQAALAQSLPAGRERLSWLVSRDTAALSAAQVRESAIETLAENLCDSVVAPLLWFALLGLPGAALYRFANTADAMWGYPGWRGQGEQRRHWQWAGKWAARVDDGLNWLPARLTALLLVLLAGPRGWRAGPPGEPQNGQQGDQTAGLSLRGLRRDARATPSPNGGWPMGAMARLLGVRLGKPGVYQLHPQGQEPQPAHLLRAVFYARNVVLALAGIGAAAMLFGG